MSLQNDPDSQPRYSHKVRIAAVGDIHVTHDDHGKWVPFFRSVAHQADVLLLCGDLTDTGDEREAEILSEELQAAAIPTVCVLGNHDYEKGRQTTIRHILNHDLVHVLDGEAVVIHGVGFAGIKGFGGGFGRHQLAMFGEEGMKAFVREAIDQSNRLDRALSRLDHEQGACKKIAVLHYSPVRETLVGEPPEILPFLGSARLLEPILRREVVAAFHGHAHAGTLTTKLPSGTEIFNVAMPVLRRAGYPQGFFIYELDTSNPEEHAEPPPSSSDAGEPRSNVGER